MAPYNLAGATLREHLFNLLNDVDQAAGSPQNAWVGSVGGCEAPACYRLLIGIAGHGL